jgi:hypothetical protein
MTFLSVCAFVSLLIARQHVVTSYCYYILLFYVSDCSRAGLPRGRSLNPGKVKNFLFSTSSRLRLGFT